MAQEDSLSPGFDIEAPIEDLAWTNGGTAISPNVPPSSGRPTVITPEQVFEMKDNPLKIRCVARYKTVNDTEEKISEAAYLVRYSGTMTATEIRAGGFTPQHFQVENIGIGRMT